MNNCAICGQPLSNKESYDVWLLVTSFDEDGDMIKTSMEPDDKNLTTDYESYGIECCGQRVVAAWNEMLLQLKTGGQS